MLFLALNSFGQDQKVYNLDKKKDTTSYQQTQDIAIYKGEKLPVYISKYGKLFIFVTSKKGKQYKKYLN